MSEQNKGENMNIKSFAVLAGVLALAACGDNTPNPEMLKGANFVATGNGTDITLSFDANEMRVNGQVVNLYNGTYTAEGNQIKFSPFASTMMMGPMDAMQTEQDYFQFMTTVETYDLTDGRLTLKNADGKEIVFQQVEPTAEVVEEAAVVEEVPADAVAVPVAAEPETKTAE